MPRKTKHKTPHDLRKARVDGEIIAQVKTYGGFSVFWATDNMERAKAIERLR